MRTVLIGLGQAGGKLAAALTEYDSRTGFDAVLDALAVNTAEADLQSLPLDTLLVGQDRVGGHGVGGDNELGAAVMRADVDQVLGAVADRVTAEAEALVVTAGLGGGTGSGGAPVLAKELRRVYDVPVYALCALPGRDEGALYQVNAARSLKTLAREADAVVLVDNDAWRETGESVEAGFAAVNNAVAQRFGLLLATGEAVEGVGESVVDTSEVINTLRPGGLAAVGYASAAAAPDAAENITTVLSLTRQAFHTGTSLPDVDAAGTALLAVAGRPDAIPRRGVERARRWVSDATGSMAVRGGDVPIDSDRLAVLLLLGGVENSSRLEEFMARARDAAGGGDTADVDRAAVFRDDRLDDLG